MPPAIFGYFLAFFLADEPAAASFITPDTLWIVFFLAMMLVVLGFLFWMEKKLKKP